MNKIVENYYNEEITRLQKKIATLKSLRALTDRVYELIKSKLQDDEVSSYRISVDFEKPRAEAELELKLQKFRDIDLYDVELKKLTNSVYQCCESIKATIVI